MAAPPERRPHRVLASLIEKLEATKPKAGLVDPATDFAVCRQFALSVYARADRNDVRVGTSNAPPTRTQVEAFSAAGTFLAALDQSSFAGMCDDDIRARRDYAEWRAWDLATAMHAWLRALGTECGRRRGGERRDARGRLSLAEL